MLRHIACTTASLAIASPALAAVDSIISVIDFEEFAEGTEIGLHYKQLYGAEFSLVGGGLPVVAEEGRPLIGFTSSFGVDLNMASGARGLTDPLGPNGAGSNPTAIQIDFDPPVTFVSLYLIDIDHNSGGVEGATVTAYEGTTVVSSDTVFGLSANDGRSVKATVSGSAITRVVVAPTPSATGDCGWALDFVTLSRICPIPDCTPRFRISQESAPGANDFATHLLGDIPIWVTPSTSAFAFYGYGVPEGSSWNGAALTPISERSHVLGALTTDGPTLFVVHDRAIPNNPDGGAAEMQFEIINDLDGAELVVHDGPADDTDSYSGDPGAHVFTAKHSWQTCCTDGVALGGIGCGASVVLSFADVDGDSKTPEVIGLDSWVAYGADGAEIALALEANRRVRIDLLPPASCPADFTCDHFIGADDLGVILGAWNTTLGAPDIDGSGLVDAGDIGLLLGLWGECP